MSQARDTYERYLQDIASHPRISPEREVELSAIILNSDVPHEAQAAIDELIHANLLLVVHCMKEFDKFLSSPAVKITRMDLIAEGNIGLMKAAERFNAAFTTEGDETAPRKKGRDRPSEEGRPLQHLRLQMHQEPHAQGSQAGEIHSYTRTPFQLLG